MLIVQQEGIHGYERKTLSISFTQHIFSIIM